jgi:A/G-specific adenine glycosylase
MKSARAAPPASPELPASLLKQFAPALVRWQRSHGRSHLPWQNTRDPYRVWLSEIMLQQTQVSTVLGYYARFLARFPTVAELAAASQDEVLGLWSGLGYYSRARNLHRCAQAVAQSHGGQFPRSADLLASLPGIGPSTAAAIASFCFDERAAILDGNVRRVLTRVLGFADDLARSAAEKELLACAQALLPRRAADMPAYTQGLMDLGATVCLPRQPQCLLCPMQALCTGRREGAPERYPVKSRRIKRSTVMLWLWWAVRADGAVWLERRPDKGIWGGLYCLPVFDTAAALDAHLKQCRIRERELLDPFVHVLTHRDLHLHPVRSTTAGLALGEQGTWFAPQDWPALGLPAPIRKLLQLA